MASAVAAIRTLLEYLRRDTGETIQGLRANLTSAIETLCGVDSSVAVSSGGELFLRFISLTSLEYSDYSKCKKIMIERGEIFLRRISLSRNKIADLCHTFIKDGAKMAKALCHLNVPVTVVLDAAVGYIMEKVDLVIVGAEGVVENGGIINKADTLKSVQTGQDLREEHPWVDYTSPSLITLLFTDLGVLTPSAVSDELIKLYL
ncbi:hypothetical protein G4228_003487 [Cervus hanglu yarkandensis]|nr:hypothetical protein G4228_003487 [Cervus hanglu yarkandensis]